MLKKILFTCLVAGAVVFGSQAQSRKSSSKPGNTLNLGVGLGYGKYRGIPVMASYEIGIAPNLVIAPYIGFGMDRWRHNDHYHRAIYVPVGAMGRYYFDDLLGLNSSWDIYGGGSLGTTFWSGDGYDDDHSWSGSTGLYLDAHIGARYHFNSSLGAYLDLSTGMSTIGVSFKM